MAIIGPRPLLVRYLARYNEEQHHRHDVRPGLTSLKIMEVMMARKKKLSELAEGFTVYPQVLTNVRVTDLYRF